MKPNPEKLTCISIIVCDEVYRDEATKKLVIIGTFNEIIAPAVPCQHPRMTVLFTLTNARGEYDLSLTIEHEKSGHQVIGFSGPMKVDEPLRISDINIELRDLVFPEVGKYWVIVKADGEIIQERPLGVRVRE